jgi:ribosomal protein L4
LPKEYNITGAFITMTLTNLKRDLDAVKIKLGVLEKIVKDKTKKIKKLNIDPDTKNIRATLKDIKAARDKLNIEYQKLYDAICEELSKFED